ncbi:MAG: DUF3570 domain-containing protein [Flavobacteriaceae bacterium]
MVEKAEVDVVVTRHIKAVVLICLSFHSLWAQNDSIPQSFTKKVLETTQVDMLLSYYGQEGQHAAVTGGIGSEELTDVNPAIVVRMPLSADDVLTVDLSFSHYTSASSSNGNPFNTGASTDDRNYEDDNQASATEPRGTPWAASTGASKKDVLTAMSVGYSHSSEDRNRIWNVGLSGSFEYDYESIGFSGGHSWLFFDQNTEIGLSGQLFFDRWKPVIPTEIHEYQKFGTSFLTHPNSYFNNVLILDDQGYRRTDYLPSNFIDYTTIHRNSFGFSAFFSQILNRKWQMAFFADYLVQEGVLANPLQRVYFADRQDYFIGIASQIPNYTDPENRDVFHLADDIERLPSKRIKTPFGMRLNGYINDAVVLRTYYRYYSDNWDMQGHTFQTELPVRLNSQWKITPIYRWYTQSAIRYFRPYNQHMSTQRFYTSDYDLSAFHSQQWGLGLTYYDLYTTLEWGGFGLKYVDLRAQTYKRSDGLQAFIISGGIKIEML